MDDQNKVEGRPQGQAPTTEIHDGPVHGTSQGQAPTPTPKPSQAEGDRETVLDDLRSKESGGEVY